MMISGANNLYNKKQIVDELNVFPVPDGDTGTNMSMTVSAMAKSLKELITPSATRVADAMSYATLRGARGNSGVILSQFFRGIAKSLKGIEECDAIEFAKALQTGSDAAYKAVMKPTEGTILTVAREVAQAAVKEANEEDDILKVLEVAVKRGYRALEKTPEMLPALKQAGVVDAGGQGWLFFLDGALEYLKTGEEIGANREETTTKEATAQNSIDVGSIKFMYCTEFIVEKSSRDVSVNTFRKAIEQKGDCMLVIDDEDIVKVHIHTNNPGYVLEKAVLMGSLINIKIDNMKHQHQSIIDTTSKKEEETKVDAIEKEYAFVSVCAGDGLSDILKNLGVDQIIMGGQTMNPSTDDIISAVNKLNAKNIFIFPNNKNIIMAANQAKEISDKNLIVIPTKSIPQCIACMVTFSENSDAGQNEKKMLRAIENVKTGQVTFAVRDTQIDEFTIKEGDIIGMADGKISSCAKETKDVLVEICDKMIDDDSEFLTIYYGEDISSDCEEELLAQFEERYPDIEVSVKYGGQALYYYIVSVE